jgi:hypothetical protein
MLQRSLLAVALGAAMSLYATHAHAIIITESFSFLGSDAGGTGSADMTVVINTNDTGTGANSITITIDNTSPILLDDQSDDNAPGIVSFGANFQPNTFNLANFLSWQLTGFAANDPNNTTPISIGENDGTPSNWITLFNDTNNDGITVDLNPNVGTGVQDALYNPDADPAGFASGPNFLTTAIFTIFYSDIPDDLRLAIEPSGGDVGNTATIVRMQNVGENGAGGLKLSGTSVPTSVPEPSLLGLICLLNSLSCG